MFPALFAFGSCFWLVQYNGIFGGKVGKKVVRELVKSFTNFYPAKFASFLYAK